jgi:oligoendopeptidase F
VLARILGTAVLLGCGMGVTASVAAEQRLDESVRWRLADLYPTRAAFLTARSAFQAALPRLETGRGTLGSSPSALKTSLEAYFSLARDLGRLGAYSHMASDEDTRVAVPLADSQEVQQLATEFASRAAWLAPEILALPEGAIAKYLAAEPGLAPYRFFLEDLERQRPHTLSPGEEKLLALSGMVAQAPSAMSGILRNADLPYPEVTLASGEKVTVDQAGYSRYRALPDRADRILVFREFWKLFRSYERTLGVALDAQVKRDLFYARARNYPNCLASALAANNVPESVYRTLIAEANRALPTLHRAFRLRGRLLGISDLAYHDIYPPLVADLDTSYPIDKGEALVLSALQPLGAEYVATVRKGFGERWMDVYPRPGKRSGAYSNGSAYDVHPYVLMNYNDDYESVSTLAHEWGHAIHSHLANAAQPYPTADYSIFIAEVASTFNEALLLRRSLDEAASDAERLFLLGSYVENLRGTYFRQTMFAEFELATHEAVERGEALTGERLSLMYGELLRRYHGHDQGVMRIDDAYTVEWAFIPHFYYNFYVYQYATSLAASTQLARAVLAGDTTARDRYLALLKSGGSRYPYDLLKEAGVDLTSPAPYRALEAQMTWAMDEIEKLIKKR